MKTLAQIRRDVASSQRERIKAWRAKWDADQEYEAATMVWDAAVGALNSRLQKSRPITEAAKCISRDSPENESPKPQEFKP